MDGLISSEKHVRARYVCVAGGLFGVYIARCRICQSRNTGPGGVSWRSPENILKGSQGSLVRHSLRFQRYMHEMSTLYTLFMPKQDECTEICRYISHYPHTRQIWWVSLCIRKSINALRSIKMPQSHMFPKLYSNTPSLARVWVS